MVWAVGARFGREGIWQMPLSELRFWYRGHLAIYAEETGGKKGDG